MLDIVVRTLKLVLLEWILIQLLIPYTDINIFGIAAISMSELVATGKKVMKEKLYKIVFILQIVKR